MPLGSRKPLACDPSDSVHPSLADNGIEDRSLSPLERRGPEKGCHYKEGKPNGSFNIYHLGLILG